jgi:hypothetical protein
MEDVVRKPIIIRLEFIENLPLPNGWCLLESMDLSKREILGF